MIQEISDLSINILSQPLGRLGLASTIGFLSGMIRETYIERRGLNRDANKIRKSTSERQGEKLPALGIGLMEILTAAYLGPLTETIHVLSEGGAGGTFAYGTYRLGQRFIERICHY